MPNTDAAFKDTGTDTAPPQAGPGFWDAFRDLINNAPDIIDSITGQKPQPPGQTTPYPNQNAAPAISTNLVILVIVGLIAVVVTWKLIK